MKKGKNSLNKLLSKNKKILDRMEKPKNSKVLYIILGIIVLLLIGFFIYKWYTNIWSKYVHMQLIKGMIDGNKPKKFLNIINESPQNESRSMTLSFWLNIHGLSAKDKNVTNYILHYEKHKDFFSVIYGDVLNTKENNLTIRFKLFENEEDYIKSEEIELQKWFNVIIIIQNRNIDLYIDNKLIRSRKLKQLPIMENNGTLNVAYGNGFEGKISNLEYFNWPLTYSDRSKIIRRSYSTKKANI